MKCTRSLSIFITLFFLIGQLSLNTLKYQVSDSSEVNTEVEFQPLIEFKFSLAKLADFVEEHSPSVFSSKEKIFSQEFRIHLVSKLLDSHHICLPPPA